MLEIDGPMCYKIIAEYYMHVIFFWLFLYFKVIFQKQSMGVKTLCLSTLFVQSNYFNQITSNVIGQKFLV
jgi:hypothetical protein